MGRSPLTRALRRLAVLAFVAIAWPAWAQVTLSRFPPNPGVLPGGGWQWGPGNNFAEPPPPRSWVNGTYGGVPGAKLTTPSTVIGPAGPLTAQVGRAAGMRAIGIGLGALARGPISPLTAVQIGVAAWDWWDENRMHNDTAGNVTHDPGIPPETTTVPGFYAEVLGTIRYGTSKVAACQASVAVLNTYYAANASGTCGGQPYYKNYGRCSLYNASTVQVSGNSYSSSVSGCSSALGNVFGEAGNSSPITQTSCPASIDASDPAYSLPAGLPVGADGKCRSGRYNHVPFTDPQIGDHMQAHAPADPGAVGENILEKGGEIQGEPSGITGPASQVGSPTTTTTTSTAGTKTQTETKTYNYTYGDSNVTYNTTTTTVTINEDGTTTTTTTGGGPAGETQDPDDPCTKHPDTVGCIKLGEPPTDAVPKSTQNITFEAENLGIAAGCPVPVPLPNGGQISYQTVCDGVEMARPLIIAMGFLMAAGIMVGGFKLE